jgi:hypothetical protein
MRIETTGSIIGHAPLEWERRTTKFFLEKIEGRPTLGEAFGTTFLLRQVGPGLERQMAQVHCHLRPEGR